MVKVVNPLKEIVACVERVARETDDPKEIARRCNLFSVYTAYRASPVEPLKKWFESLAEEERCVLRERWRGASISRASEVCKVSVSRVRSALRKYGDPWKDAYLIDSFYDDYYAEW